MASGAGFWLTGPAVAWRSYPLFLLAIGSPLNLSFVGAFAKTRRSGFGSAGRYRCPVRSLWSFPIIISATAAGMGPIAARPRAHVR